MDKNGQLNFSDDPFLLACNTAYQLIEEGSFSEALGQIDEWLDRDPDYPGLADIFRTARFWENRMKEMEHLDKGKLRADFLMNQWEEFIRYAREKGIEETPSYRAVMKFVFFSASEHYKIAFMNRQSTVDNFDLLLNLGICFVTLEEYKHAIDTLEYARSSYRSSAKLLSLLGESFFHDNEIPKSLVFFREAFFVDPADIDLGLLKAKPIKELVRICREKKPGADEREWIPIFGYLEDLFYVKRQINSQAVEAIKREIYTLEKNYQKMTPEKAQTTNIIPRLINKYLWMLDYFEHQNYDFTSITEIRNHLIKMDKDLFEDHFMKEKPRP